MKKELIFLFVELAIYFAIYELYRTQREILEKLDLLILDREFEKDQKTMMKPDLSTVPRPESSRSD